MESADFGGGGSRWGASDSATTAPPFARIVSAIARSRAARKAVLGSPSPKTKEKIASGRAHARRWRPPAIRVVAIRPRREDEVQWREAVPQAKATAEAAAAKTTAAEARIPAIIPAFVIGRGLQHGDCTAVIENRRIGLVRRDESTKGRRWV